MKFSALHNSMKCTISVLILKMKKTGLESECLLKVLLINDQV